MKIRNPARKFVLNRIPRQTPEWISRGHTLFFILSLIAVFGGLALLPSISSAIQEEKWTSLSALSGAYVVVLIILFKKNLSYYVRSSILCFSVAIAGYVSLSSIGLVSSARLWFLCSAVLACLLIGGKSALAVFLLSFVVLVGFGYKTGFVIKLPSEPDHIVWIITSSTFVLVNILVVGATYLIVSGLKKAEASLRESEERFRLFAELAPVGIILSDRQENTLYVSPKFTELFGYTLADIPTVNQWWPLAYPDEGLRATIRREWEKVIDEAITNRHEIKPMEFPVKCRDGIVRQIEFRVRAADDMNVIVFSDITDRKQAEEELSRERKRLASILEGTYAGTWEWNVQTGETIFNERWAEIIGYSLQEISPVSIDTWMRLIHPDDVKTSEELLQKHFSGELHYYECEARMRHKNGEWVWVLDRGKVAVWTEDGKPLHMMGTHQDITERKLAENSLKRNEKLYRTLFSDSQTPIFMVNEKSRTYIDANQAALDFMECTKEQLVGKSVYENSPSENLKQTQKEHANFSEIKSLETHYLVNDKIKTLSLEVTPLKLDGDTILIGIGQDITDRKQAEAEQKKLQVQLNQAQKMESVGRLAGGVAHDFNNMLGVILGHTEMALEETDPATPLYDSLQAVQHAAERSAALTRQLLAFARKQTVAPKVIDINDTVAGMLKMLRRLIGEDINLLWQPGKNLQPVKVDPSQIDQLLANLCVNARDAIEGVGKVTIETGAKTFDEEYCTDHLGFLPGEYVLLEVSDDGCGMDQKTLSHIFEPFFTTKEQSKGTGLGLASVFGMVKQNNGFINVYSEPDQGTTFKIYLPVYAVKSDEVVEKLPGLPAEHGNETILLVEDETAILEMATRMLERLGYTVVAAATPGEAIRLAHTYQGRIDLLMTDVVMPEMNGRELAGNLLSHFPDLKRLFMSGYTANVIAHHGVLAEGVHFIQKPFSKKDLGGKLREALEG